MAKLSFNRLTSGPDAGKLRVSVVLTLSPSEERCVAKYIDTHIHDGKTDYVSLVNDNLNLPVRRRGVGKAVADYVASAMLSAFDRLVLEGSEKFTTTKKSRRGRKS